jgi:hypothetical protein
MPNNALRTASPGWRQPLRHSKPSPAGSTANAGGTALDRQVATLIFAESIAQLTGGLPMGQNEIFRPADLGLSGAAAQSGERR